MNAVSLFSNCGAGDVGFRQAGFRFSVMAELIRGRLDVALANHPEATGVPGDLRETWPRVVEAWRRMHEAEPSLLAACPPCQGLSTARSDRGFESDPDHGSRDGRNLLVMPIAKIAQELNPKVIVVENVPAFLTRRVRHPESGAAVSAARLLMSLLGARYAAFPLLADLADYGVPQTRRRAFLTFIRRDHLGHLLRGRVPYPLATHGPNRMPRVTVRDALARSALPSLDASCAASATDGGRELHFVPVWSKRQYAMVAAIPSGSGASAWENNRCATCGEVDVDEDAATCPLCHEALLRPVVADAEGLRLVNGFRRSSYRRLSPDVPAATITTASGRVGSSRTIHPTENRVLSPLECAVLQTFPPNFEWDNALEELGVMAVRAMIGEAVPPAFTSQHGQVLANLVSGRTRGGVHRRADGQVARAWSRLQRKPEAQGDEQ